MQSVTLKVNGMSCNHCVQTIKKVVGEIKGVDGVEVDLEKKEVEVKFEPGETNRKAFADAIEDAGYDVVG